MPMDTDASLFIWISSPSFSPFSKGNDNHQTWTHPCPAHQVKTLLCIPFQQDRDPFWARNMFQLGGGTMPRRLKMCFHQPPLHYIQPPECGLLISVLSFSLFLLLITITTMSFPSLFLSSPPRQADAVNNNNNYSILRIVNDEWWMMNNDLLPLQKLLLRQRLFNPWACFSSFCAC